MLQTSMLKFTSVFNFESCRVMIFYIKTFICSMHHVIQGLHCLLKQASCVLHAHFRVMDNIC